MGKCDQNSAEYLFDELAFFQPTDENELYMVKPKEQKGIHCRFGMKGVIAENHFDGSRNMIVILGGERRYILSHPDQCENLMLYPKGHPSARHSEGKCQPLLATVDPYNFTLAISSSHPKSTNLYLMHHHSF